MPYQKILRAIYTYEPEEEEELAFDEDDLICILSEKDEGWYEGQLLTGNSDSQEKTVGLVPANYLEPLSEIGSLRALYDYMAQEDNELGFKEDERLTLLNRLDSDWWLVRNEDGFHGLIPSNYVELLTLPTTTTTGIASSTSPAASESGSQSPENIFCTNNEALEAKAEALALDRRRRVEERIQGARKRWSMELAGEHGGGNLKGKLYLTGESLVFIYGKGDDKAIGWETGLADIKSFNRKGNEINLMGGGKVKAILGKSDGKELERIINEYTPIPSSIPTMCPPPKSPVTEVFQNEEATVEILHKYALYDYVAQADDETDLKEGQELTVVADDWANTDDEWIKITRIDEDGQQSTGLVPRSYVGDEVIEKETEVEEWEHPENSETETATEEHYEHYEEMNENIPVSDTGEACSSSMHDLREDNSIKEAHHHLVEEVSSMENVQLTEETLSAEDAPSTEEMEFTEENAPQDKHTNEESNKPPELGKEASPPLLPKRIANPPPPPPLPPRPATNENFNSAPTSRRSSANMPEKVRRETISNVVEQAESKPHIQEQQSTNVLDKKPTSSAPLERKKSIKEAYDAQALASYGSTLDSIATSHASYRKDKDTTEETSLHIPIINKSSGEEKTVKEESKKPSPWSTVTLRRTSSIKNPPMEPCGKGKSGLDTMGSLGKALPSRPTQLAPSSDKPNPSEARLWKDRSGQFQTEAVFLSYDPNGLQVLIHKLNGSRVKVPLDLLSDRDVEFVARKSNVSTASLQEKIKQTLASKEPVKSNRQEDGKVTSFKVNGFDWLQWLIECGLDSRRAVDLAGRLVKEGCNEQWLDALTRERLQERFSDLGGSDALLVMQGVTKRRLQALERLGQEKLLRSLQEPKYNNISLPPLQQQQGQQQSTTQMMPIQNTSLANQTKSQLKEPLRPISLSPPPVSFNGDGGRAINSSGSAGLKKSLRGIPALVPQSTSTNPSLNSLKIESQPLCQEYTTSGLIPLPNGQFAQQQTTTHYTYRAVSGKSGDKGAMVGSKDLLTDNYLPAGLDLTGVRARQPAVNNYLKRPQFSVQAPVVGQSNMMAFPSTAGIQFGAGQSHLSFNPTLQPAMDTANRTIMDPTIGAQNYYNSNYNSAPGGANFSLSTNYRPIMQPMTNFNVVGATPSSTNLPATDPTDKYSIFKVVDPKSPSLLSTNLPNGQQQQQSTSYGPTDSKNSSGNRGAGAHGHGWS